MPKKKEQSPKGPFRYARARKFYSDLRSSYSQLEKNELLSPGLEFLNLGLVKLELEFSVPVLNILEAHLEEHSPSRWNIPPPFPEQYIGETRHYI